MFILLSGRMGSGKTVLSNDIVSKGYERVSFASYLRELISKLYSIDIDLLKSEVGKKEILKDPIIWNKNKCDELFQIIGEVYSHEVFDKEFFSRRDALQYIGSDVLKNHKKSFHAEKLVSSLDANKDYVCDDLRFPDELQAIVSSFEKTKSFHIIRPSNRNFSNHVSEISLNWTHFRNVIVNDGTEEEFKESFYEQSEKEEPIKSFNEKLCFLNQDLRSAYFAGLFSKCEYENHCLIGKCKNKKTFDTLKCISYEMSAITNFDSNSFKFKIIDPFIIENLKLWKSEVGSYPPIINNNPSLIKEWNDGVELANDILK